jgi:hypothetical protein
MQLLPTNRQTHRDVPTKPVDLGITLKISPHLDTISTDLAKINPPLRKGYVHVQSKLVLTW